MTLGSTSNALDTAVAIIPKASSRDLAAFLTERLPEQAQPWVVFLDGKPAIFVNIVPAAAADLEEADLRELKTRLGSIELTALLADLAVRNVGCAEVRELIATVLDQFSGLASDDIAERWWTAEEIRTPERFNLQAFWPHEVTSRIGCGSVDA